MASIVRAPKASFHLGEEAEEARVSDLSDTSVNSSINLRSRVQRSRFEQSPVRWEPRNDGVAEMRSSKV